MTTNNFAHLESVYHALFDQLKRNEDAMVLFVHWFLVKHGFTCVIDGRKTEILPKNWNSNKDIYQVDYSHGSKGFELKVLIAGDSLIFNLMKKSTEKTANATCTIKKHVTNFKNDFQSVFIDIQDLYDLLNDTLTPLFQEEKVSSSKATETAATKNSPAQQGDNDPLRVGQPIRPRPLPDSAADYGRRDLDPLSSQGIGSSGGGMVFDPFRDEQHRRDIPRNLPPGAVPPRARFDPFGPPDPDHDLYGGDSRVGPNPNHLKRPGFGGDDNMFM